METISEKIREVIATATPKLMGISPEIVSQKADPGAWSKQELLGHLIDSALNNHQRFVRGAQNTAGDFPAYDQNRWVEVQGYNKMNWLDLVDLFSKYNLHLCRVIDYLPPATLNNPCNMGKENPVTLEFVIVDYLRHLKLHLEQILGPLA